MARKEYGSSIPDFENTLLVLQNYEESRNALTASISIAIPGLEITGEGATDLIAEAKSKSNSKELFTALILNGDQFLRQGKRSLVKAYRKFAEAAELGYDPDQANRRLETATSRMETAYRDFLERRDLFFKLDGGCADALANYRPALEIANALGLDANRVKGQITACAGK